MSGLDIMKKRMNFDGGASADERNVRGKYLSFKSSLENSYQAEWITLNKGLENEAQWRCLINPDKLTSTYDQKEISIDFKAGLKNGDVFYWDRTKDRWIVFLQKDEEEAYFRASCRRCKYKIGDWWVYLKGPSESAIEWSKKSGTELNELNNMLFIYVTKTDESLAFFKRFQIVKFDGHNWRVTVSDSYSMDGIIECYLEEYYDNEMEDEMIVPEIYTPDTTTIYIDGSTSVYPYDMNLGYTIENYDLNDGSFKFLVNDEIVESCSEAKIRKATTTSCKINILAEKAGSFTLCYVVGSSAIATLPITINPVKFSKS